MSEPLVHRDLAGRLLTPRAAILVIGALVVLRVVAMVFDPNSLHADETQYWLWSRELDWGYFSKPPLIAWVIAATTAVFGNADWGVRLAAPFLHAATAGFLGLAAARLFDTRTGVLAAILWAVMPGVWLSSQIISTDAVLMTGWAASLYCLARLREGTSWPHALGLGLAVGWAFLAKYAAIYLLVGAALSVLVDAPSRRALLSVQGAAAGAVVVALLSGNLAWNAANDFATVSHTAANANWAGDLFNFDELIDFLVGQLGVFGPISLVFLVMAVVHTLKTSSRGWNDARPALMLVMFTVPPILIVSLQAFISRAHANWAASAYGAGTILLAWFVLAGPKWRRGALVASLVLHVTAGLALLAFAASTPLSDSAGLANAYKRVRQWPATAAAVERVAEETGAAALAFDNRNDFHQMQRYGTFDAPLYMWMRYAGAHNFAEAQWPLPETIEGPVLIVSERPDEIALMARDFARFEPAGESRIALGGGRERVYRFFVGEGYDPLDRDAAYEAQVEAIREAYGAPDSASSPQTSRRR
ncbi:ArnT family glycosyltransferase [Maricaulaceae bacterium MS644]